MATGRDLWKDLHAGPFSTDRSSVVIGSFNGLWVPIAAPPLPLAPLQCGSWQQPAVSTEATLLDIVGCSIVQEDFAVVTMQGGGVAGQPNFILWALVWQKSEKWSKNGIKSGTRGKWVEVWASMHMQYNCNAIFGVKDCFGFIISILELIVKKFLICKFIFYQNFQKTIWKLAWDFYFLRGDSVRNSPPKKGSTGKFFVCVGQNVTKWSNFLRIFDILTFHQYFVNILLTLALSWQADMLHARAIYIQDLMWQIQEKWLWDSNGFNCRQWVHIWFLFLKWTFSQTMD